MPDNTPAIEYARAARDAIRALDDLDPKQLAANPAEVYNLLDHLTPVVSPLWRISSDLGAMLDKWADERGLSRPTGEPSCALHIAADRLRATAPALAGRLYAELDAAQHILDPTDYRSRYGLDAAGGTS